MKYNSSREQLHLREYGRNLQRMIAHTKATEDGEKRNKMAKAIIDLMGQMNPGLRNVDEFRHMLWDHLYIMADFNLDVDSEYPIPEREKLYERPKHLGYPKHKLKYRHYGKNVMDMVEKAKKMDDPEKQKGFALTIGNYMKLVYRNWSRENINDQTIAADLLKISDGVLVLPENANLDLLAKSTNDYNNSYQNKGRQNTGKKGGHHKYKKRRK